MGPKSDEIAKEIDDVIAHTKNEKLKLDGTYLKAGIELHEDQAERLPQPDEPREVPDARPQGSTRRGIALLGSQHDRG